MQVIDVEHPAAGPCITAVLRPLESLTRNMASWAPRLLAQQQLASAGSSGGGALLDVLAGQAGVSGLAAAGANAAAEGRAPATGAADRRPGSAGGRGAGRRAGDHDLTWGRRVCREQDSGISKDRACVVTRCVHSHHRN